MSPWRDWHETSEPWRKWNQDSVEIRGLATPTLPIRKANPESTEDPRSLVGTTRSSRRRQRQDDATLRRSNTNHNNHTNNYTTTERQDAHDTHNGWHGQQCGGNGGLADNGGEVYLGWWWNGNNSWWNREVGGGKRGNADDLWWTNGGYGGKTDWRNWWTQQDGARWNWNSHAPELGRQPVTPRKQQQCDLESLPAAEDSVICTQTNLMTSAQADVMTVWHAGYGVGYNNGHVDGYRQGRQAHAEADIANAALEKAQTEQRAKVEHNPQ